MLLELLRAVLVSMWLFTLVLVIAGVMSSSRDTTGFGLIGFIFMSILLVCCILFGVF